MAGAGALSFPSDRNLLPHCSRLASFYAGTVAFGPPTSLSAWESGAGCILRFLLRLFIPQRREGSSASEGSAGKVMTGAPEPSERVMLGST